MDLFDDPAYADSDSDSDFHTVDATEDPEGVDETDEDLETLEEYRDRLIEASVKLSPATVTGYTRYVLR